MLEQDGRGNGIDISFAAPSGPTHLADRAKRSGGGEPLIYETDGKLGSFLYFRRDHSDLGGARGVVAVRIQRQANDVAFDAELGTAANHFGDRRTFATAPLDESDGRSNGPRWVTDGQADTTLTVVNGEKPSHPAPS
jgi:hypothetical protein